MSLSRTAARWLARLGIDLRPGEAGLCARLFALHFLILEYQYTVKAVRQSAYVDTLGAERLPLVYLLAALATGPVLGLYGRWIDRFTLRRLLAGTSLVVGLGTLAFWAAFDLEGPAIPIAFYLWTALTGILLVSQLWSYAGERLDARQARRLFGLVGAGGILGSVAGGLSARWVSQVSGTRGALLVAAFSALVIAVLLGVRDRRVSGAAPPTQPAGLREAGRGWGLLRRSSSVRWLAALMLVSAMVAQFVDLQFSWAVERSTATLDERTALFGTLYGLVGVAAFLFQMLLTPRIHRQLGTGFALRILPASNGFGAAGLLITAAFAPAWVLPVAWALKMADNGLRYSLDQSTRELLFLPIPAHDRARAKAFVDVFVQRVAKASAAILLLVVPLGWLDVLQTAWISLGLIALWMIATGLAQRSYVAAFREGLMRTRTPDDGPGVADAGTLELLVEGLGARDPRVVLQSVDLLVGQGRGRLVHPLLLHHAEPAVRRRVLEVLAVEKRTDQIDLVESSLGDADAEVRLEALRTLAELEPAGVDARLVQHLRDPDVRVRATAIGWVAVQPDEAGRQRAERALDEMLADGVATARVAAAEAVGELPEPTHQGALVRLLYDSDVHVVRAAVGAVRRRMEKCGEPASPLYIPILVSHLRHRQLKHDARAALVAYGESVVPALRHFLADSDEDVWVRRAIPKTLAAIGGPAAASALSASLSAPDSFQRRKVVESLVALRVREGATPDPGAVDGQLGAEVRGYLRNLADLSALRTVQLRGPLVEWPPQDRPHLLESLLSDRMTGHFETAFGLLALLHDPRTVRGTVRGLRSERQAIRAHALEYLDNALSGEVRRLVFAMVDEVPVVERLRQARRLFDIDPGGRDATLRRLVRHRPIGDAEAVWLTAAALHYVEERGIASLRPLVVEAIRSDHAELVQETARYLLPELAPPPS